MADDSKFAKLVEQIEKLTVLELSELVKELEEKFGVSAAAPMMMGAMPAAAGAAEPAEEKTSFTVVLTAAGEKKIEAIKAVREVRPDLGLKEAKDLVDGAPKDVLTGVKKEEADNAKAKLEAAGATVDASRRSLGALSTFRRCWAQSSSWGRSRTATSPCAAP